VPSFCDLISYAVDKIYNSLLKLLSTCIARIKCLLYGIPFGPGLECFGTVYMIRAPYSRIELGKNVQIISSSRRATASTLYAPTRMKTLSRTASIIIGDGVGMNGASITSRSKKIIIGDGTMLAPNVVIVDFDGHALWPPKDRQHTPSFETDADVVIGKDVWIGMGAIILKGVSIGDNSVIGARSVVTRNVPSGVLTAGVPAKVVRLLANDKEPAVRTDV